MDLGDWSIRNWKPLAGLTTAVFVAAGGLAGYVSDYTGRFPALGGPNGLLYDMTLKTAQPWRRHIRLAPVVLVAIDDASLATPELAALPRALFQPVWARLIDGLLDAGARRIAFDVVFAYAGTDFKVGSFTLPGYDQSLIDSLARGRDRIVLARFPKRSARDRSRRSGGNTAPRGSRPSARVRTGGCEAPLRSFGCPTGVSPWALPPSAPDGAFARPLPPSAF